MKQTILDLNRKFLDYDKKFKHFDKAIEALAELDTFDGKREMVDKIRTLRNSSLDQRQKVLDAISSLQAVCDHKNSDGTSAFRSDGNDSHYNYERCSICDYLIKC